MLSKSVPDPNPPLPVSNVNLGVKVSRCISHLAVFFSHDKLINNTFIHNI